MLTKFWWELLRKMVIVRLRIRWEDDIEMDLDNGN
jgi:hypothetical protein